MSEFITIPIIKIAKQTEAGNKLTIPKMEKSMPNNITTPMISPIIIPHFCKEV